MQDDPATPRLYDDLAWLWPLLSPPEHYEAEAESLASLIRDRLGPGRQRIVEFGAGGGHTLVHLAKQTGGEHECVAVDLSESMLSLCRDLISGIDTQVADMRNADLGSQFDVVLIHDAIDYLLTREDVERTLRTAFDHLRPGGLACIAPTYTRESFVDGDAAQDQAVTSQQELTYLSYVHDADPSDSRFEMLLVYLLRTFETGEVQVIEDRHACGLFAEAEWMEAMRIAGFEAEHLPDRCGAWSLFLGRRP